MKNLIVAVLSLLIRSRGGRHRGFATMSPSLASKATTPDIAPDPLEGRSREWWTDREEALVGLYADAGAAIKAAQRDDVLLVQRHARLGELLAETQAVTGTLQLQLEAAPKRLELTSASA